MSTREQHSMNEFRNLLEPDRLPSMSKIWSPLIPNKKERYLTPEELKMNVLTSPRIIALINEFSDNNKKRENELKKTVQDMLNEIGLSRSLLVIRWIGTFLNKLLQRICTAVYVNERSIAQMKETMGDKPILYLPSHRSYADFVLMSYICFAYDFEIPGIASGMDFHEMVGAGSLLRKTGAFFMRRSFSTDKLYWHVFKEYMRSLVNVYHIGVEFFIEGTRSRSCKALMPKIGLLSMALEPLFMGEVSDITIVPIGVAYEKPLEEHLFVYELLGVPKPKESTMGLFKALKILDINYGSMYVNFGKPISVRKYLGDNLNRFQHAQLPVHVQHLTKSELGHINNLAHHVISEQQQLIVLTTFNLVSIYFSCNMYLGNMTTMDDLCEGVHILSKQLTTLGALVATDDDILKIKIYEALNIHSNILQMSKSGYVELMKPMILNLQNINVKKLKGHNLTANTIRNAVPAFSLQIYCNPCLHWLVSPAFMILASHLLPNTINVDIDELREAYLKLRKIFSMEFVLDPNEDNFDLIFNHLTDLCILNKYSLQIQQSHANLANLYLSSLVPFLCCYLQVVETILAQEIPFTEKDILVKTQQRVEEKLNAKDKYVHPYCLSLDSISIALKSFHVNNFLEKSKSDEQTIYHNKSENLHHLRKQLLDYCQLLPFNCLDNYLVFAKL